MIYGRNPKEDTDLRFTYYSLCTRINASPLPPITRIVAKIRPISSQGLSGQLMVKANWLLRKPMMATPPSA